GQQLVMTPQLQQAIRLLQLSAIELDAELVTAVESNPLLDWTENMVVEAARESSPAADRNPESTDNDTPAPPEADWGGGEGEPWYQRSGPRDPDDDDQAADQVAESDNLQDH